jgi:plasmid stability protein
VSAPVRVFLAGEGSNELGVHARDPAYRGEGGHQGVLCTLLTKVQPEGWQVGGTKLWKDIHKLKVGAARGGSVVHQDTRNVLKLAVIAEEAGHDVLAFSRDLDADKERKEAIEEGLRRVAELFPKLGLVGGVAVPALEGWVLALLKVARTEGFSREKAQAELSARGFAPKDGAAMVDAIADADLAALPHDADALRTWLARAQAVLPPRVAASEGTASLGSSQASGRGKLRR